MLEYQEFIEAIEKAYANPHKKSSQEYHLIKNYEILNIADTKKIIKKRTTEEPSIRYLVPKEDIFDAILACHQNIGHKGRDLMMEECSKQHLNLTANYIKSM